MADVSIIIATNAEQASKEIGGLSASIAKSAAKANQMAKAFDFLDRSFNKGKIDAAQYSSAIVKLNKEEARLYSTLGKTTTALNKQASAMVNTTSVASKASVAAGLLANKQRMAGKSTNKFGMYSQQVGYQVGDFAVQVQSGTNALVAFGQQGTQLAGLLPGLAGAVLGIGLAIGTAVARSVLDAKKLEIDFKAVISELKKPLETIKPIIDAISGAFKSTGKVAVSVLSIIANNLDRVVLYITVAATAFGTKLVAGLVAAKLATFTLAGAFAFLRTAIIRTGIGAIIIGVAEAIRMFFLLKKQLGGVGPLLDLMKRVFFEVLGKISDKLLWLGFMAKAAFYGMKVNALTVLRELLGKVNSDFVNKFVGMVAGMISAASVYIKGLPAIFVSVWQDVALATANGINSFVASTVEGVNKIRVAIGRTPFEVPVAIQTHEDVGFGLKGRLLDRFGGDANSLGGDSTISEAAELGRKVSEAFTDAMNTDYVSSGQSKLTDAINTADKAQTSALKTATSLDASYQKQGTALAELSAAYNALGNASDIDFGEMLKTKTDDDDDSKSKAEDPIKKLKAEIALNEKLVYLSKEKGVILTETVGIQKTLAEQGKTYDAEKLVALVKTNEELKKQRENYLQVAETIDSSMGDAFMAMIDGTLSVKDAFKQMAADIIKELMRVYVVQQMVNAAKMFFGLPFADGGAFSGGSQIQAYADGGVVGGPTTFPMAGGKTGLMGEAGPEAIMPLKRGANGKLGVQMEGGGGQSVVINQSFNFQANGDDSVKKIIAQAAPQIANLTKKSMLDDRRRGGQMKATFG